MDYNVPLGPERGVEDPGRIRASYPTLRLLLGRGARPVLISHLGRPGGEADESLSLRPVARFLEEDAGRTVRFGGPAGGDEGPEASRELGEGEMLLMENTRFHPGEKANDPDYAGRLARLGDLFVNDAFAACHRAHASTHGVGRLLSPSVAGLLVERELRALGRLRTDPSSPFVLVMGGAKIADKLPVLETFLDRVDAVLTGGGVANTLLAADGRSMADSLVEEEMAEQARELLERAGSLVRLPDDLVVAPSGDADDRPEVVEGDVPAGWAALDVGPRTRRAYAEVIEEADTVFWNGPVGVFESEPFDEGTDRVARSVARAADRGAFAVVGGGDTARAAREAGVADRVSHVSTGGGAALEYLSTGGLPALEVLDE